MNKNSSVQAPQTGVRRRTASQRLDAPRYPKPARRKEPHVIFGTGPVGTTLADELLERGKQVRLINRSGQVPAGAELVAVDASKLEQVQALSNEPQIVDLHAFTQTFDLHATPLDEAIRSTVAWYQEHMQAANTEK